MVLRVLLVDDDEGLTETAREFLERDKDLKVDISTSAENALERLKNDNYEVIVADDQMPGMNGIELLKKLRSVDGKTPFILFTGRGREEVAIEALNNGASFCLQKGGDSKSQFTELANMIKKSAQRHRMELDLIESVERFKHIFESANDSIYTLDLDGRILEINDVSCRLLGYTKQEMLHLNMRDIDSEDSARKFPARMKDVTENGFAFFESEWVAKSGKRIPIEVNARRTRYAGRPVILAVARDITARKQADAALRELEKRYHNLVEEMLEGVAYCRMLYDEHRHPVDWIYLTVNSNFEKLTGLRNVTGRRVTEAIPGIEKADPNLFEIYGRVASNGQPEEFETEVRSLGQWMRVSAFCPEKDHFVAIFEDITQRKKSDLIIAESSERQRLLESIMERSPAIAFTWKAGPEDLVTFVSGGIKQFGYMPEDFTSARLRYSDFVHPEDAKRVLDESMSYVKKGVSEFTQEYRIVTKSGDVRWVDDHTVIVRNAAGEPLLHQGIVMDVTEPRRVERALKVANAKLALLGSVTRHDAVNQLSVLMAWLDIAMESGKDLPAMEHMTKVQEAAQALKGQLEFTSGYQEMGMMPPQWIDVKTAAGAGIEGVDLGAVSIKFDLKGVEIYADSMIEKVFHNLMDNSLRHGKKVTLIRLHVEEAGEMLSIVYEDDGVGVPVDEKETIFVRGFGEHMGLGLYLVREILGLTGISIRETGSPCKGARFEMLVPAGNHRVGRGGE